MKTSNFFRFFNTELSSIFNIDAKFCVWGLLILQLFLFRINGGVLLSAILGVCLFAFEKKSQHLAYMGLQTALLALSLSLVRTVFSLLYLTVFASLINLEFSSAFVISAGLGLLLALLSFLFFCYLLAQFIFTFSQKCIRFPFDALIQKAFERFRSDLL